MRVVLIASASVITGKIKDAINVPMAGRSLSMEERGSLQEAHQAYFNMTIASLLNAHIVTISSERQTLWLCYTAMVLANALMYGFLMQLQAPTTLQVGFTAGFGWALCMAWLALTIHGFRSFILQLDAASAFAKPQLEAIHQFANPVNSYSYSDPILIGIQWRRPRRGPWQLRTMVFVIVLFMLAYAFWLVHHLYYMFIFVEGPR
jgi:hypothetical protein